MAVEVEQQSHNQKFKSMLNHNPHKGYWKPNLISIQDHTQTI